MSVVPSLFLQPIVQRTANVSLSPVEVLSAQTNFSAIDNILVVNLMDIDIFVSIYISSSNFLIIPKVKVTANSILQLLKDSYFCLETGSTLSAVSDSSQNLFNIQVEGRVFKEVV